MAGCSGNRYEEALRGFDEFVADVMGEWKAPGIALSVVEGDEMIYSKAYGMRDPDKGLPMRTDTLFRIASNTKAFTTAAFAILVDEGKLDWDKPVKHYIPTFKLYDPYATEHVTPRDLMCHRTGLPDHSCAMRNGKLSRGEIMELFRYLEPSYPIRTKLQYNNWMFTLTAYLTECVTGQSWDRFVQERIFDLLGMKTSNFSYAKSRLTGNYAECFSERDDGEIFRYTWEGGKDPEYIAPWAPSGAINSNADEMANWMIMHLNKGKFNGKQIISEASIYEMHCPQMIDNWITPYEELGQSSCGLGWFSQYYRGYRMVLHSGFYGSSVFLVPQLKIGCTFLGSLNLIWHNAPLLSTALSQIIFFKFLDRYLGLDEIPWREWRRNEKAAVLEINRQEAQKADSDYKPGTKPSHALDDYCGVYEHPAYLKLNIKKDGDSLIADMNGRTFTLKHYHYDTFKMFDDGEEFFIAITFHTDAKGQVSTASAPFEPAVKDIIFNRV